MTTSLSIWHEGITGASLSGTDGATNRTYVLANSGAVTAGMLLNVQGQVQQYINDFTFANNTITFLNAVFDSMTITIDYYTGASIVVTTQGYGYVSTTDVYRTSGLSSSNVSVVDVSNHILEAEVFVCRLTKNIYYKTNLNKQVSTSSTNNTLVLTGAGWTVNDWANQYVYIQSGTGIGQYRQIISNTADTLTVDRDWTVNPPASSQFKIFYVPTDFNPRQTGVYDGNNKSNYFLPYYPLTSLETLTINGVNVTTSNVYQYPVTGKLELKPGAEASLFLRVYPQQVLANYWYGVDNFPYDVKRLAELRAAIQTLSQLLGSKFDILNSINLPEMNISVGQPHTNIKETVNMLQKEFDTLVQQIKIYPVFSY